MNAAERHRPRRVALRSVVDARIVQVKRKGRGRFPQFARLRLTLECGHVEFRPLSRAERDAFFLGDSRGPKRAICDACRGRDAAA